MDRRVIAVALFVSLALNVFVVGAFVGARLGGGGFPPPDREDLGRHNPVAAAMRTLPPDEREAWRTQMSGFVRDYGPKVRAARDLARRTMRGFGREPFDADATLADLRRARALEAESRSEMDRRLVDFAATLPAANRARFGEALARPPLGRGAGGPRTGDPRAGDFGAGGHRPGGDGSRGGAALPDR